MTRPAVAARPEGGGDLVARLETGLPQALEAGAANAFFVSGTCFHRRQEIRELRVGVAGEEVRARGERMPRPDQFEALHIGLDPLHPPADGADPASADDPELRSYRSGFWAIVPVASPTPGARVDVLATLADGSHARASLGTLDAAPPRPVAEPWLLPHPPGRRVAICMATFDPPQDLLERQLESIVDQTHGEWICCISDDGSSPERFAALQSLVAGDERFRLSRAERRLGHYGNFERALGMAPADAEFVALCDQDDRWHPDKLEVLLGAIGGAALAYSDARLIGRDGELISDTYWSRRRNNHTNLTSLLIANTVTGAASLARRELIDLALPFPPRLGHPYHDHWLAIVALATGEVTYVDRPLYDYVQHGAAQIGHAAANLGAPRGLRSLSERARRVRSNPRRTYASWRAIYFFDVCRIELFATVAALRGADRIRPRKRRALRRAGGWDASPTAIPRMATRRARALAGRNETLGAEGAIIRGLIWRNSVGAISGRGRPLPSLRGESRVPSLEEASGRAALPGEPANVLAQKVRPLELAIRETEPVRVNVLLPTIDLRHFFGGYVAKLNLARRLSERGHRVRIVTVDPTPPLPRAWRREVEAYGGLGGAFDRLEVAFGREDAPIELNPADALIATTWWTAHVAAAALSQLRAERFLYLIQEYEPFTFPMGSLAAAARESYDFEHRALFSSELLREWFAGQRIGTYAGGRPEGDRDSASFQNAITPVPAPRVEEVAARRTRRLLFYARPEPHAARNMFELGLLGLQRAVEANALGPDWEVNGVGATTGAATIDLGRGAVLRLRPRTDQDEYAKLLAAHDVGLALMYTPHPSLAPIEMASAGMITVTNTFANKTSEAMAAISPNLIAVEPTVAGVAGGIAEAVGSVGDHGRRVAGADVAWSRDWNDSLDDRLMERVEELLDGG